MAHLLLLPGLGAGQVWGSERTYCRPQRSSGWGAALVHDFKCRGGGGGRWAQNMECPGRPRAVSKPAIVRIGMVGGWGAVGAGKGVAEEVAFELALKTEEVGREKGREWHSRERE